MEVIKKLGREFSSLSSSRSSVSSIVSTQSMPTKPPASTSSSLSTFYVSLEDQLQGSVIPIRIEWLEEQLMLEEQMMLPLDDEEEDDDVFEDAVTCSSSNLGDVYNAEISYIAACGNRHGSLPTTPILGVPRPQDSTPNRLVNFFAKRSLKSVPMKRTKSVTKVGRSRLNQNTSVSSTVEGDGEEHTAPADPLRGSVHQLDEDTDDPLSPDVSCRLRASRSRESLLSSQVMDNLNITAGEVTIKALHNSILGQEHCFQVTSPTGTRFFSCRTADERDRWVDSLRKAVNPNYEQTRRKENVLKMFILEAKGVNTKKKYYCELLLDGSLYARTSSKAKNDSCFWGELFEFESLPAIETICVVLRREADKKKKKDNNMTLGRVTIPVASLQNQSHVEKWYKVQQDNNKNLSKDPLALRIKCKFQSVDILPLDMYSEFLQYIKSHYSVLCQILEPAVNVKTKEEIATCLVHIMQHEGQAEYFLADLVMLEFQKMDDPHLLFRGNSLATKAMEAFMKLVGEKYLINTLGPVINRIIEGDINCEVDPMKIPHITTLKKQQENLLSVVRMTWSRILNSHLLFPLELRECFKQYREHLTSCGKTDLSDNLISASIFLRFFCPAILSPSLFNITQEFPDDKSSRNLTLIAKTLQTLANFTKFQGKENFMEFMNEFIEAEQPHMKTFLQQISSSNVNNEQRNMVYDGEIDLGKQLSMLHTILSDTISKITKSKSKNFDEQKVKVLQNILEDIDIEKAKPSENTIKITSSTKPHSRIGYQSLKRDSFKYNDNDYSLPIEETANIISTDDVDSSTAPKSSTLPRNTYLLGSRQRPALDLNTADDYVIFSALKSEKPRGRNPIGHRKIQRNVLHSQNQTNTSPIYANQPHRHRSIDNIIPNFSNINHQTKVLQQPVPTNNVVDSLDISQDDIDDTSLEEAGSNFKGSQSSISQLSTVASSGYQSFTYSQSSSPVDPTIMHHDRLNNNGTTQGNNNRSSIHNSPKFDLGPLTFNNPMYSSESPSKYRSCHLQGHGKQLDLPKTSCNYNSISSSINSAKSVEDLISTPTLPPKTKNVQLQSENSSFSNEVGFTIFSPTEILSRAAPRTNPRCLPPGRNMQLISSERPHRHHSASDLLESHRQKTKTRRLSTEPGGYHSQYKYESDSSSDNEQLFQSSRYRKHRSQYRISDSKTLDEYEEEILALRSAMEEMHHKLTQAEVSLTSEQILRKPSRNPKVHPNHHQSKYIPNYQLNKESACRSTRSCSSAPCEHSKRHCVSRTNNIRSYSVPSHKPEMKNQYHEKESNPLTQKDNTSEHDKENSHMKDLLNKLLVIQKEFRDEKLKLCDMMNAKNAVILAQEDRMNALERTNNQLLLAIDQIREIKPCNVLTSEVKNA